MLLCELLKEEGEDIALAVPLFILDLVGVGAGSGVLKGLYLVPVNAGILLDGVDHRDALKGLAEIHLDAVIGDRGGAEHVLSHGAVEILGQIHHTVVIGVGLIKLHEGEFGVVPCVKTLVSENAADLVDLLHAADYQPLEVKLKGDAQLEILVQSVEMSLKRSCGCAAGVGDEHRGLDLDEALGVKEFPYLTDYERTLDEGIPDLGVHNEVEVTPAVAHVGVGKAVELLGQRQQRL